MPTGLPNGSDHFWQYRRSRFRGIETESRLTQLRRTGRIEHSAAYNVSGKPDKPQLRMMREELPEATYTPPLAGPGQTHAAVTEKISSIVLTRHTPLEWFAVAGLGFMGTMVLFYALAYLLVRGIGIWGVNVPVAWGFAIVNFVWWIGIGHAGTLISAILLLLHQA